jgi:hypothetical protein
LRLFAKASKTGILDAGHLKVINVMMEEQKKETRFRKNTFVNSLGKSFEKISEALQTSSSSSSGGGPVFYVHSNACLLHIPIISIEDVDDSNGDSPSGSGNGDSPSPFTVQTLVRVRVGRLVPAITTSSQAQTTTVQF